MLEKLIRNRKPVSAFPAILLILGSMFLSSFIANAMDYKALKKLYPVFRTRKWEDGGKLYQKLFKVKSWKEHIPSISSFDKKNLSRDITVEYVEIYLLESIRAELCHALITFLSIPIIVMSPGSYRFSIIVWTVSANMPCIIIQRFNRPRFEALARKINHGKVFKG